MRETVAQELVDALSERAGVDAPAVVLAPGEGHSVALRWGRPREIRLDPDDRVAASDAAWRALAAHEVAHVADRRGAHLHQLACATLRLLLLATLLVMPLACALTRSVLAIELELVLVVATSIAVVGERAVCRLVELRAERRAAELLGDPAAILERLRIEEELLREQPHPARSGLLATHPAAARVRAALAAPPETA